VDIAQLRLHGLAGVSIAVLRAGGKAWLAETDEDKGAQRRTGWHGGNPLERVELSKLMRTP
jgi:hypothetical protein